MNSMYVVYISGFKVWSAILDPSLLTVHLTVVVESLRDDRVGGNKVH
jgi:hypothetical protein